MANLLTNPGDDEAATGMRLTEQPALPTATSRVVAGATLLLLASCASYAPLDLPTTDALLRDATNVSGQSTIPSAHAPLSHRFDPSDGLDRVEVATLAVLDNPGLKSARADTGVSRAQAFAAGLLPDPQISASREHQLGFPQGATIAFATGLVVDFGSLITHRTLRRAADADTRKAELNLLWQEWQLVAQAELLFTKIVAQEKTLALLHRYQALFNDRWQRSSIATAEGLLANDAVTPYLTVLQDVNRQLNDLDRQNDQSRHDLDALLGIDPTVRLKLVPDVDDPHVDAEAARAALHDVLQRRPDLVALRAGFEAEDARYRAALLAQFPGFTFGPTRARDTTDVNTTGFAIGLTLPVFNRNRGNIAIEEATREKLRVEYQNRLDATTGELDLLLTEQGILEAQRGQIAASLVDLDRVTSNAERALGARNVDALVLTNVQASLLAKQIEEINVREALAEERIALQTLLGPDVDPAGESIVKPIR